MFTYMQGYDMSIGRRVLQSGLKLRLVALFALTLAVLLLPSVALAQSASLTATVNSDRSVNLDLSNGPGNWWFRINSGGACTAVSGTTVSNISGYKAGTHSVNAYSDGNCGSQIASASFTIPTATLAATVNGDRSVDLTLTGGPSNWWFRIKSWDACTAVSGTTVSNISGYKAGTHTVNAYSDSGCDYHIASSSFTIPSAALAATVNGDSSVDLTLSGGPGNWWFRINSGGACTAAAGTTVSNISGYQPGTHSVNAYSDSGCSYHIASSSFTIAPLPPSSPPPAPAQITIERVCDHKFKVSWTPSVGATGYDLNFSTNDRKSWQRALTDRKSTVHKANEWTKDKTYWLAVRARNSGGVSGWTNSAAAPAPPCEVGNLRAVTSTTHGTAGGSITTTWDAAKRASAYNVNYRLDGGQWQRIATDQSATTHTSAVTSTGNYTVAVQSVNGSMGSQWRNTGVGWLTASGISGSGATLTIANHSGAWYVKQTLPTPSGTCSAAISGATHDLGSLSPGMTHTFTAYSDSSCANAIGSATFTTLAGISVSDITATGATLTIAGHSGNWWYKANTGPDTSCSASAVTGATKTLTGLSPVETYTYSAYSASGCADANLLATAAAFTTGGVSVSNLSETSRSDNVGVLSSDIRANAFTTGDHGGGYTLDRVVIKLRAASADPGTFTAAIYEVSGGFPTASATYTLSGNTTPTTAGDYTYNCSGICTLDKETTYFLVLSGTSIAYSIGYYRANSTLSDSETNTPSNAGWSIANRAKYKYGNNDWADESIDFSLMFEIVATENVTLSASGVTTSGATLTIGYHSGQWWYKADTGPHATCQGPVAAGTSSKTLTGLSPVETYTYSAYSASGCADANLLATAAAFTTGGVSVSNLSETSRSDNVGVLSSDIRANAFTTGDHGGGYTLDRVVIKLRAASADPGTFTAAIYEVSGGFPTASATYTLSGNTTPTTAGDYTYNCSGICTLDKETTYFLVLSGTSIAYSIGYYRANSTLSDSETNTPSNAGWSIANRAKYKYGNNDWADESIDFSLMFEVVATAKP